MRRNAFDLFFFLILYMKPFSTAYVQRITFKQLNICLSGTMDLAFIKNKGKGGKPSLVQDVYSRNTYSAGLWGQ